MLNKVRAALFLGVTSNANMVPGNFTKPRDPTFTMAATPLLCRSFADQLLEFMDKTHVMWQTVAFMIVPGLNEHSGQRNAAIPYDEHNVPVPFPSAMCLVREHLCYWAFYKKKKTDWQRMTLNKIRAKHVGFDERVDMVFNRIIWLALSHRATGFPDADLANIAATIALPRGDAAMRDWLGENPQDKGDLLDEKALRSEVMELHKTIKDRVNTRDELEQRGNGKRFKLKNLDQIFPREVGKFALASPEVARALKWSHLNWFVVGGNNRKTAVERIVKNMIFCVYVMRDKVEPLVEGNLSRRLMRHKIFAAIQGATMLTSWEPWWDWPENDTDQAEIVLGQTELRAAEKEMKLFAAQMEKRFCTRVWGAVPNENGKDAMHPGVTVAYHNLLTVSL
ncbi:hypothetical protein C8R43DRAFT_974832 [Mycena crocata]|nr:hypothetical protein C8R43DRAFT_1048790 [Mycena crocata]KAJ7177586.1 hypothetical protein C8R43DRAFT_974832 [Mycena crocata]